MTLEFLDNIFKELFSGDLAVTVTASKVIASIIVLIFLTKKLYNSFGNTGEVFSDKKGGLSPTDLITPIFIIILIGFSSQILNAFDTLLVYFERSALDGLEQARSSLINPSDANLDLPLPEEDVNRGIYRTLLKIFSLLNPATMFTGSSANAMYGLSYLVDSLIYPFFLAKRYFIMGIVKIFFPLMLALSIFEKTKDYSFNILKIYARAYLSIIPMIFAVWFCDQIFNHILDAFKSNPGVLSTAVVVVAGETIRLLAAILIIFIKIALFKQSVQLMDKIIP